ncbi:mandelate racemase/muconate lactonizing enzyme family protein [Agromyces sp. SYSU T00194]|uniref:mandelate racemase/muconate lactonizing enzyme family protein n=1 Tax=Agromyces chitinivorans TaxID=3158560 RepID=UPI0033943C32
MSRITAVTLTAVTSPRSGITCGHIIVQLATDVDGLVGIGEMSDFQHLPMYHIDVRGLEATLTDILVGRDPMESSSIAATMDRAFPSAESLYDKASLIRCGVDLAIWDLRGKLLDANVSELLGGRSRARLPIAYPIFRQQTESDVESNLEVMELRLQDGMSRFRVYVGRNLELDRRFLMLARDRFGDRIEIKSLDFSNLLDARAAAGFIARTAELGYEFVEAPARSGDLAGLRFVRERTLVPVSEHAVGPRSALDLVTSGAVDVLNVGLFVLGGITGALRTISVAEAAGVACLMGTTQELSIGTAAAAHVGTCVAGPMHASDPVGPLLYQRDVVESPVLYEDSDLVPPEGPGLGLAISDDALAAASDDLTWRGAQLATIVDRTGEQRA